MTSPTSTSCSSYTKDELLSLAREIDDGFDDQVSRRQQRKHTRLADDLGAELETARQRWNQVVRPVERRLSDQIDMLDRQAEQLGTTRHQRAFWRLEHPTAIDRLVALNREIARLEHHADIPTADRDVLRRRPPGREPPGLAR